MAADYPTAVTSKAQDGLHNTASNVSSTLSADITGTPSTFTTASAIGFPSSNYDVLIDREIIHVSSRSGTTHTIGERGHDGTASIDHDSGATVAVVFASDHAQKLGDEVIAIQTEVGPTGSQNFIRHDDAAGSYAGHVHRTGASAYQVLKSNLAASVAPATTDDSDSNYSVGSIWIDTTADNAYLCVDASVGAAVWEQIDAGSGSSDNSSTGTVTLSADSDADGSGIVDIQTRGTSRLSVENLGGITIQSGDNQPSQDYRFLGGPFGPELALVSQTAGANCNLTFHTADADGTDSIDFILYRVGDENETTNYERFVIQAQATVGGSNMAISSEAAGTGTVRPINFMTGGTTHLSVDASGNVVATDGTTTTSRTNKFLYVPTSAGAPTGTPTSYSGRVALAFDTTNNRLYVYDGGWVSVTLT